MNEKEKFEKNLKTEFYSRQNTNNQHIIFLNNPNWSLVTSIVSGISKTLNINVNDYYHLLTENDFKFSNKIQMEAFSGTHFNICKFKDYAPFVFQSIRRDSGISNENYIRSIGLKTFQNAFFDKLYLMISESSTGKSGSFFFHTSDG